jgi:hypothetical protein
LHNKSLENRRENAGAFPASQLQREAMKSISTSLVAFTIAICLVSVAGCFRMAEETLGENKTSKTILSYVQIVGRFTECDPKFSWSENWIDENGSEVHDDGLAPRLVFHILSPVEYANRVVGILYKHEGKDVLFPPSFYQKGKTFSFEIPSDFFVGQFETIDNIHVRNFRAMP